MMKLTVLQENILPRLQDAIRFISSKSSLPILSGVHLKAADNTLTIQTTDLKVGFQTRIGGKVEQNGECIVSAKVLTEMIASLRQGPLILEATEKGMHVSSQKTSATLPVFPVEDFPPFPQLGEQICSITGNIFSSAIDTIGYAASLDETRPVLASILCKVSPHSCTLAATDGYRLAVVERACTAHTEKTILIPAKTLIEVARTMEKEKATDVLIFSSPELAQISFVAGDTSIIVRETEGEFPNFAAIIPPSFAIQITLDREGLIAGLKTALVIAKESSSIVSLHLQKNQIKISGSSSALGSNEIELEAKYTREDEKTISFNAKFLLDALTRFNTDQIELHMNEELKPVLLRPQGDEQFTYIVMPFKK